MVDLYEDDPDLFVAGLAAGNQRVAVSVVDQLLVSPLDFYFTSHSSYEN